MSKRYSREKKIARISPWAAKIRTEVNRISLAILATFFTKRVLSLIWLYVKSVIKAIKRDIGKAVVSIHFVASAKRGIATIAGEIK